MRLSGAALSLASLLLTACHRKLDVAWSLDPQLVSGQRLELRAGQHAWAFHAKPHERYRVEAGWVNGQVTVGLQAFHVDPTEELDELVPQRQVVGERGREVRDQIDVQVDQNLVELRLSAFGTGLAPMWVRVTRELDAGSAS